ncbi:hypothetical protein L9F63_024294 [Diploptera punctata]|uniref:Uncharacterized protein n=1 Tax=Diploptera punctata TaxID=6984 RepID=A0AAD8E7Z4_DIPPU|nr:hypothetical protein L9F63_024294 [Diploptera punctata]
MGKDYKDNKRLQSLCYDTLYQVSDMCADVINDMLGDEAKFFKQKIDATFNLTLYTYYTYESNGRDPADPKISEGMEWDKCMNKSCEEGCTQAVKEAEDKDYQTYEELLGYCKTACENIIEGVQIFLDEKKSSNKKTYYDFLSFLRFR